MTRPNTPGYRSLHPLGALPRLAPQRAGAAAWNALGLCLIALAGAGLVHLLAYHIPGGAPLSPRWVALARAAWEQCSLGRPFGGAVVVIAALAMLLAAREVRRLRRQSGALGRQLAARRLPVSRADVTVPRSPRRLAALIAVLLGAQVPLLSVAMALWPMRVTMVMGGARMAMRMSPSLPLWALHLAVAALLGLLLWRVEHRLTQLRAEVARRRRLLAAGRLDARALPPIPRALYPRPAGYGHAIFARPPPAAAIACPYAA